MELTFDHFLGIVTYTTGGTPSLTNSNNKVSFASLLDAIQKALAHPKAMAYTCAYLLQLLDTVLANIV